ncbi:hypothetical protein MUP29_07165, partial [bacterium]|nr:hypothetical protein [bacterium]
MPIRSTHKYCSLSIIIICTLDFTPCTLHLFRRRNPLDTESDSLYQGGEGKWRISLKNKMPDELKNEITTYL